MRTAVNGVDVVGKTENRFGVCVVVLQTNFHGHAVALGFHVNRLVVQHLLAAIEMLDELGNPAGVFELGQLRFAGLGVGRALVSQRNQQAFVEEGEFAQARGERVEVVFRRGKDAAVG